MKNREQLNGKRSVDAARLLARGGRVFSIAALAHARGQNSKKGPWYVLPPETVGAVEEILIALEEGAEPKLLETLVRVIMTDRPATVAPKWARPIAEHSDILERIGLKVPFQDLVPAFGQTDIQHSPREKGLAAFAIGLARSLDSLRALALLLPEDDGLKLVRMGHLAHVLVEPGTPMKMRGYLKQRIKEVESIGANRQGA